MKDEHTYGKKMARKVRTKVIYKGTFICIQTLLDMPHRTQIQISVGIAKVVGIWKDIITLFGKLINPVARFNLFCLIRLSPQPLETFRCAILTI